MHMVSGDQETLRLGTEKGRRPGSSGPSSEKPTDEGGAKDGFGLTQLSGPPIATRKSRDLPNPYRPTNAVRPGRETRPARLEWQQDFGDAENQEPSALWKCASAELIPALWNKVQRRKTAARGESALYVTTPGSQPLCGFA